MRRKIFQMMFAALVCAHAHAQVNSGSNGSDGVFNPATNTIINMADHPNGIYQYTSVNISNGVTVTFIPNTNNSPVTWLVQGNCEIDGTVDVSGQSTENTVGGIGGPGGGAGGNSGTIANSGQGPGGGGANLFGGGGSFGTQGGVAQVTAGSAGSAGQIYGNSFLLPLLGGSGGGAGNVGIQGGSYGSYGGGGGGGAILMAASGVINLNGTINAVGGGTHYYYGSGGGGSGGGVRLVAVNVLGTGQISAQGGQAGGGFNSSGGLGRVRVDAFQNNFGGQINGVFTQGFQPIIIPVAGQGVQLSIASVAGASVSATPNGQLVSPDVIISGQQANPIPVVVNCANLPLNTLITVTVKPASGSSVSAVGYNTAGTLASSMATVSIVIPRGGGLIYATAATSN